MLVLIEVLPFPATLQAGQCTADGPLLTDKTGKPLWLNTESLVKSARHCVAPRMPPLARQARMDMQVFVDILIDEQGHVACVELTYGPPLVAPSAIEAAKDWLFWPKKQEGKAVSFQGHLRFHFSTTGTAKDEDACTVARF